MAEVIPGVVKPRRKRSKRVRRQQLIDATIETLARHGYAGITIADVARNAGLSNGIVIFHFDSKERLLVATLKHLAEEYRQCWQDALEEAGTDPAERLFALISADFAPQICTPHKLAAWCAFWAEAQSRPAYLEHCGANDGARHAVMVKLCAEILAEAPGSVRDPVVVARAIDAATDGLWLNLVTSTDPVSLENAEATVCAVLAAFFPHHFTVAGLKREKQHI